MSTGTVPITDPAAGGDAAGDGSPGGSTRTVSFWSATRMVAEREIQAQVQARSFWVLFGLFVVGVFAAAVLPGLFGGGGPPTVATVGPGTAQAAAAADLDTRPRPDVASAEELVRAGEVDAALVPDDAAATGLRIVALESAPDDVVAALSAAPEVDLLEPAEVSGVAEYLVTFAFALVFLMFGMGFGMGIAQSVVTEKQTRIVEILVATVPVRALLAGKIAAHSLLAFGQVAVLALLTPLALRLGEQGTLLAVIGPALGWFVPFFILGFVLLAGVWAVAGALVDRQEDLGSTTPVVTALVMLPYFAVLFLTDNEVAMTVLSYVPFSAAVAMPVRLFSGDAAVWEPVLALVVLAVALVATVLVAVRLYSGSLLQTSGRVRLRQAWSHADRQPTG